jgi:tetratricopeptide (TPR) repeat protein
VKPATPTTLTSPPRAARASLATLPAELNIGGLRALAEVEYALHNFAAARDHATRLTQLEPDKSYPYQILGETLVELGDYERAAIAYRQMQSLSSITTATESRLARLAFLRGETEIARRHLAAALAAATNSDAARSETVAWCQWQLGELSFAIGDYKAAEQHYRDSLNTFPDYFRALAGLARTRAAHGDLQEAINGFERATRILPDPVVIAALGDLYKLAGRDAEAAQQYRLVERIAHLGKSDALYNRQLALFYADHDMKAEEAYRHAVKEYETRPDIYGADAVAWTALKAGKLDEAQAKIKEALRLDTKDAKLYYHAGMIARAAGDATAAREYLKRALTLNPHFDFLQAAHARATLDTLQSLIHAASCPPYI